MHRYPHVAHAGREVCRGVALAAFPYARHEPRIPVPAVAAIGVAAKVLVQSLEVRRARAVGQVAGDELRGFLEARKAALHAFRHEAHDLGDARRLHLRRNIDEGEGRKRPRRHNRLDHHARDAAQRCAHESRTITKLRGDVDQIRSEALDLIVPRRRPAAVAVTAQVERDGAPTGLSQPHAGLGPGMASLAAAVSEQHGAPSRRTVTVGCKGQALITQEGLRPVVRHALILPLQGAS